METKTFTIVDTETQTYKTIQSNATTCGELKEDLRAAGFNLEGKTIQEAYTKTEMLNDASVLPTNVEIKRGPNAGTTTNNLVFRLTKSNKNIKSGASRQELYAAIKEHDLAAEIQAQYGISYTNLSNEILEKFISDATVPTCTECVLKGILEDIVNDLYDDSIIDHERYTEYYSKLNALTADGDDGINRSEIDALIADLD